MELGELARPEASDFAASLTAARTHAARVLNVAVCLVAGDLALPMYPGGLTPGLSVSDALATCGLPP